MIVWAVLAACRSAPTESASTEPAPSEPAPVVEVPPAPVTRPTPAPEALRGLSITHRRVAKGRKLPEHVSATWIGEGEGSALQVMITGLERPCEPAPEFSLVVVGDRVRLVEAPYEGVGGCTGAHTLMMRVGGQPARDITLDVVRADGSEFASVDVGADER